MYDEALISQIESALNDVRPHLQVDGGNIELVEITSDFEVRLKWLGACQNCSMSAMTMQAGVEAAIKSKVPQIRNVVAIN